MVQIIPSILSADFCHLGRAVDQITRGGARAIHIDVMDGHFVPNISIGLPVVVSLKRYTKLPSDVHLMIDNPDRFIPHFIKAGADRICVHVETCPHLHKTITTIKSAGVKAGAALNPGTPLGHVGEILPKLDYVLIMSVNPGFGGQIFIPESLDKIKRIGNAIRSRGLRTLISVDGGVNLENAPKLARAGAKMLVAGAAVFRSPDPAKAIVDLINATKVTDNLR
jgi:ribulose-phosphate 3-epimerase